jgi:hypothetical protein
MHCVDASRSEKPSAFSFAYCVDVVLMLFVKLLCQIISNHFYMVAKQLHFHFLMYCGNELK